MSSAAVAFDASWIDTSGIGRFAAEVLAQRPEWVPINRNHRATDPVAPIRLGSAVRRPREKFDVVVSPGYMPPVGCATPYAVTLHDLMYLGGGANHSRTRSAYFRLIKRQLIRSDCVVLTVSEYSKRQIVEWTNGKTPVHVVGNGVSPVGPTRVAAATSDRSSAETPHRRIRTTEQEPYSTAQSRRSRAVFARRDDRGCPPSSTHNRPPRGHRFDAKRRHRVGVPQRHRTLEAVPVR